MSISPDTPLRRLDLSSPRYDQNTFEGRARHFFASANPLNVLATNAQLDAAKYIVDSYNKGEEDPSLTEADIWKAKELYDSAFHCQTGEKLFLLGRMSFQVPGNMFITGCMMTFYKTRRGVVFWFTLYLSLSFFLSFFLSLSLSRSLFLTSRLMFVISNLLIYLLLC